ncbi:latexin isoform X1 [Gallus gallus]|uniref:latexin isoform X1 n=1 Tax=Gallus gallus TaxID=9031 RepID=UPI000739EA3B|nr:latexin isoform X1 [Gallus gallus]|eukprot:XP_015147180.1 latexin isoform X1 [Gallus gallus]
MAELPPTHGPASRAAALATAYISHRHGSPGHGWVLRDVRRARREDSTVNCTAEVLYHLGNEKSAPDVQFTIEGELKNTDEADNAFYNRIQSLKKELEAENIPDSYGNVSPEMQPIRALAWAASGYVIWQNSTENTKYQLAQIKHVKQVKRTDEYLEFDYVILLHENVSQEIIPWQMTVLWHPQHGIEVTQNSCQAKHALD